MERSFLQNSQPKFVICITGEACLQPSVVNEFFFSILGVRLFKMVKP